MTKSELLRVAKPILFNTDMVRAILDGRKTVTRRIVKKRKADAVLNSPTRKGNPDIPDEHFIKYLVNSPYPKGKILYVRETWTQIKDLYRWERYFRDGPSIHPEEYVYKADNVQVDGILPEIKWHPSIHMPKEATRIFLKVADVRVERLKDITADQAMQEGITISEFDLPHTGVVTRFSHLWDSTIKKSDIKIYGWDASPWVWVIEFERILPDDCLEVRKENESFRNIVDE